jgi:predicted HTH transcriptional regulator
VFADEGVVTAETIRLELAQREGESLELKSSLLFDHDRAKAQPNTAHAALKSEEVLHSSLKTIAAFLTSSGGTLLVGVDDSTAILGIAYDFACMTDKPERQNPDGWELVLRGYVQGRFKDGAMVNDYVRCSILSVDGQFVARVNVSPRRQLSFLKHKEGFALYKRQGNQTVQVGIEQIEEFLNLRKSLFD